MKNTRIGLFVAAALCVLPVNAWGQKKAADKEAPAEGAEGEGAAGEGGDAAAAGEGAEGAAGEGEGGEEVPGGELPEELPGGEGLGDICQIDPAACPKLDMNKEAAKPLKEQIYAVQQLFALRVRRFEVNPYWSVTLNDQFVSHPAPGLALNYYITNVLAIGANFNYYRPFNVDSEFNAQVRRAARVGVPLTEYDWGAALNFTYVPAYGKFAGFGDFIFHYDAYVVGGVGAISTRPIPVIDPDNRNFDFEPKIAFNAGLGLRIFFNRWFAAILEVRDYVFNDKLENTETGVTLQEQQDSGTWYGDSKLTNNVQAQLGVSIFLPFSFEYRLPK
ncbi:MAG: outer membrane beta-barrel domain-containing protein [Myxococcales bacterium]|nr:outer membrane beta-barrel domain-containing protein [Myxococcales bacterium]MCB9576706.1 outer membrane beta-barrel domain-containing protein [Polyangiaceae bacterium]